MTEEVRICLTGGTTGGHLFPLIFVAREVKKIAEQRNLPLKIFYLGSKPFKEEILKEEGIEVYLIPEVKLRKYFTFKNFVDFLKLPFNFFLAFYYLFKFLPNVIFSKGGPGSLGVVISGFILGIPVIIHDSDSIPGLTNRFSSFFAKKIYLAFESAQKYFPLEKTKVVGQPIDQYLIKEPITLKDYERYGLDPYRKVILVLGGSQGSQFLNDLIVSILPELLNLAQVVHQTGEKNFKETYIYAQGILAQKNKEKIKDYHPFSFLPHDETIYLMKMADLIITRAGSSTIFEISALGKPSILIPIEKRIAGMHQIMNARIYQKYGACIVLEEENAKPHLLLSTIREILTNPSLIENLEKGAKKFAKVDSAKIIAEELIILVY